MADLDLDELEQLRRASEVPGASNAAVEYAFGLILAAPALIAAARAAQHRGETLGRVAEAVGYPRDAHYGDVLGRIDEIVAERDRLRALCREAADALGAIDSALECECVCDCASDEQEHEPECERCAACTVDNVLPARLRARLRAAGGGT